MPSDATQVDPVCGMSVDRDSAAAAWEHAGQTYLFCSIACYEAFRADPEHHLRKDPSERHM